MLISELNSGYSPEHNTCSFAYLCEDNTLEKCQYPPLANTKTGQVRIYKCGHAFHEECLTFYNSVDTITCPSCSQLFAVRKQTTVTVALKPFDNSTKFAALDTNMTTIDLFNSSNWNSLLNKLNNGDVQASSSKQETATNKKAEIELELQHANLLFHLASPVHTLPSQKRVFTFAPKTDQLNIATVKATFASTGEPLNAIEDLLLN